METLNRILFDPAPGKLIATAIGMIVIVAIVRFARRVLLGCVQNADVRYRARKFLTFIGYLAGILYISIVYSEQLGGLTVAFGVAGAGVAFALQEIIASFAGWAAISFGGFHNVGERVQPGGIKGDLIDIGVLRATLMEVGQWVNGDLYSGRAARIANSFVFKEPVFNYSGDFSFLGDEVTIPVRFAPDRGITRETLERVANKVTGKFAREARAAWKQMVTKFMIEDARVEPIVTMVAHDNWMEFTVRYVVDYNPTQEHKRPFLHPDT